MQALVLAPRALQRLGRHSRCAGALVQHLQRGAVVGVRGLACLRADCWAGPQPGGACRTSPHCACRNSSSSSCALAAPSWAAIFFPRGSGALGHRRWPSHASPPTGPGQLRGITRRRSTSGGCGGLEEAESIGTRGDSGVGSPISMLRPQSTLDSFAKASAHALATDLLAAVHGAAFQRRLRASRILAMLLRRLLSARAWRAPVGALALRSGPEAASQDPNATQLPRLACLALLGAAGLTTAAQSETQAPPDADKVGGRANWRRPGHTERKVPQPCRSPPRADARRAGAC